jgi:hypothetical protein
MVFMLSSTTMLGTHERHSDRDVAGDTLLRAWTKAPASSPIVAYPPGHLGKLLGWRDPFMLKERGPNGEHQMIVGSGIEGEGGTVLLYRSQELLSGEQLAPPFDHLGWGINHRANHLL